MSLYFVKVFLDKFNPTLKSDFEPITVIAGVFFIITTYMLGHIAASLAIAYIFWGGVSIKYYEVKFDIPRLLIGLPFMVWVLLVCVVFYYSKLIMNLKKS